MTNKNIHDYINKTMNPISPTFCAAKWYNATIWLGNGTTASCHHPIAHNININEIKENPSALHNTKHKKEMRKLMLEGKRPTECQYCWKIEDMNNAISDRFFKTKIYNEKDIKNIAKLAYDENINPKTLEIAFDRNCNFACSYCNPAFSTTWAKDIKTNGIYYDLTSDGSHVYTNDGSWIQPYEHNSNNPYIEAFWKWWPELKKSLIELRITGGEPLMSPEFWKLLELFIYDKSNINFSFNSNLGAKEELIDKLIEKINKINCKTVFTSCEATGKQAEYIRDGLNYNYWKKNVEKILYKTNIKSLNVMMTINALCLFSLIDFLNQILQWKQFYGKEKIIFSTNILRFPSFMNIAILPSNLKQKFCNDLQEWLNNNKNNLLQMENEGIYRLIEYLKNIEIPFEKASSLEKRLHDFKYFYLQYNNRRNKNIYEIFPKEFTDWFKTL